MTLLLLLGCNSIQFAEEWDLDRLRLLAVRAEPAEPRPGDFVTFTSLGYAPGGTGWSAIWFACVAGSEQGCTFDPALLDGFADLEGATAEEQAELFAALQAAGLIGVEPGFAPAWAVPADALAGLTDEEALEGTSATVQITLTTGDLAAGGVGADDLAGEGDAELVLRRLPVSLAPTPNTNPDIGTLEVEGNPLVRDGVTAGTGLTADVGREYEIVATLAGELEEYAYVTTEGVAETRTEELEWRWYTDNGRLGAPLSVSVDDETPTSDTVLWTPDTPGEGVLHAVVLDGRGGMGWWSVAVTAQ